MPLNPVPDGSGHAGTDYMPGWINGLSMARLENTAKYYPHIDQAVSVLCDHLPYSVFQIMVNKLEPSHTLERHRDGLSYNYRFHLPIITNELCEWWDEIHGQWYHFREGIWHGPVPYAGILHSMANRATHQEASRYHLIVDLIPPK